MKSVQNVTTKPLKIRGEILTVNGIVPITYRVSAGGIYPLDNGVRYLNLDELLRTKAIKFVGEETPEIHESVVEEPDSPVTNLTPENSDSDDQFAEEESSDEESSDEVEVVHEIDEVVTEPDSPEKLTEVSQTSSAVLCPHCGGEFASERGLKRHISSAHPSQE